MTTAEGIAPTVSPLSAPIHHVDVRPDSPVWRDNAFLLFWDPDADVYGSAHVSTSPNGDGRRARFSLIIEGHSIEIVEPLDRQSFTSASIDFDVTGNRVRVDSQEISADLSLQQRFSVADYAAGGIFPSLRPTDLVQHYQQGLIVTGRLAFAGRDVDVHAHGLRDRTWGYRDEATSMREYVALVASFPDHTLTVMRMLAADGTDRAEGYRLTDIAQPLNGFGVTRDAAGFLVEAHIVGSTIEEFGVRAGRRRAGFWVPMGAVRRGPAIRAFDEFVPLRTTDGQEGFGVVEQAVVHQLF